MESIKIEGTQRWQSVYVSAVEDRVWMSIMHANGSTYINLSADGAEKLIEALRASIANVGATLDVRYQNEPVEASE